MAEAVVHRQNFFSVSLSVSGKSHWALKGFQLIKSGPLRLSSIMTLTYSKLISDFNDISISQIHLG